MSSPPRNLPRFLPTLTEVVQPAVVSHAPFQSATNVESLAQRVTARVEVLMESRLRQMVEALVQEQVQLLNPKLQQESASWVKQAVTEAIAKEVGTNL